MPCDPIRAARWMPCASGPVRESWPCGCPNQAAIRPNSELKTAPSGSEATYGTYSITLITLQPYPRSDRAIQPNDYVATFTVNAR